MSTSLSYVLVTPYTVAKSRTGGVLSRLLSRTTLDLVGAQIFTADREFADTYADLLLEYAPKNQPALLPEYVKKQFGPSGGRAHRALLLLFKGENPCEQLINICGHFSTLNLEFSAITGETIRDTYSDLIYSRDNPEEVRHFEPAVLTPRSREEAEKDLRIIAGYLEGKGNLVQNLIYPDPSKTEKTLVIIKPDNWTRNSSRPGAIIDMFSRTGLRIIGIKIHRFSLSDALDFYGPLENILKSKLSPKYAGKAGEFLEKEFEITLSEETLNILKNDLGVQCAKDQFHQVVEFMSGKRPGNYSAEEIAMPGSVKSMILVYEGENAIDKIRDVLGPTNPSEAPDGTVRREFGSNVMVNTAHASDSPESFQREQAIVKINENTLVSIIREQLAQV